MSYLSVAIKSSKLNILYDRGYVETSFNDG